MGKTHFEQVPVNVAKQIAEKEAFLSRTQTVSCAICKTPVELERCKTDENGDAIHETCYVAKLTRNTPLKLIRTKSDA
jgi:hypothetical protein